MSLNRASMAAVLLACTVHATDLARARRIQERILAPCCYSETVAHHRSDVALEIKREIEKMVDENKTDNEIVAVFTARYGRRILAEPEGRSGLLLKLVPAGAITAGVLMTVLLIRKMRRRPAPANAAPGLVEVPDDFED